MQLLPLVPAPSRRPLTPYSAPAYSGPAATASLSFGRTAASPTASADKAKKPAPEGQKTGRWTQRLWRWLPWVWGSDLLLNLFNTLRSFFGGKKDAAPDVPDETGETEGVDKSETAAESPTEPQSDPEPVPDQAMEAGDPEPDAADASGDVSMDGAGDADGADFLDD